MTIQSKSKNLSAAKLSVVIAAPHSCLLLMNCLDSVLANENQSKIEIIAAVAGEDFSGLIEKYPSVRFLQFPENSGISVLAAAGIARSKGEIIAITDSACTVDSNWAAAIINAHQSPFPVIGGAVEARGQMKLLDWAAYFCEYGQFAYPLNSGAADALPGSNISFKREILATEKQFVEKEFWKTLWCRRLQSKGIELISEPAMLIYYEKKFKLISFLIRRFRHGRCFAGMRAENFTFFKRLVYFAGSFLLPLVFFYRTIAAILGKKRFFKELLLSLLFIAAAVLFWSLGETCGYLAGKGKSCNHIY